MTTEEKEEESSTTTSWEVPELVFRMHTDGAPAAKDVNILSRLVRPRKSKESGLPNLYAKTLL